VGGGERPSGADRVRSRSQRSKAETPENDERARESEPTGPPAHARRRAVSWFRGRILSEVSKRDIERFLLHRAEQGLSVATRNRDLSLLSSFFKLAVTLHAARENPTAGIKRLEEQERAVPFLSVEEQNHLIQFCPPRIQDLVATAIDTGCREGELLKLEWKDVDLKRGVVTLRRSKNMTVRVVQLTSRARQRRKARRRRRTIPLEGPDLVFHDLRHVCAVNLIRAGLPDIKAWLGHKSMAMVFRYAGHVPEDSGILALQRLEARLAKAKIAES
jgi:integrase